MTELTPEHLRELRETANAATPGPWYHVAGDDDYCMNCRYVATEPYGGYCDIADADHEKVIAITLLQAPRYADVDAGGINGFDVNGRHIAAFDPPTCLSLLAALDAERQKREAAERWAKVWKAKAKDTRWWERDMRESANYWSNEQDKAFWLLCVAEAERDSLRAQLAAAESAHAARIADLEQCLKSYWMAYGAVREAERLPTVERMLTDEISRLLDAHAAQLLAVAEAVLSAAVNVADSGYILPCLDADEHGHYGHLVTVNTEGVAVAIRALDLAALIQSALDGSVAGVGKAGE